MSEPITEEGRLLKKFLQLKKIEGICKFWIDDDNVDDGEKIWIMLVWDLSWAIGFSEPESKIRSMKNKLRSEIKDVLGLDVEVGGHTIKNC